MCIRSQFHLLNSTMCFYLELLFSKGILPYCTFHFFFPHYKSNNTIIHHKLQTPYSHRIRVSGWNLLLRKKKDLNYTPSHEEQRDATRLRRQIGTAQPQNGFFIRPWPAATKAKTRVLSIKGFEATIASASYRLDAVLKFRRH